MVFSSISFLFYFLPVALGLYFLAPGKIKNLVLLIASLFFYAWGEPAYVLLMIASIFLNYGAGRLIAARRDRLSLGLGIAANLLILGFFKYADFLIGTLNTLTPLDIPLLELPLPIGISFYTFQAMSYLVDVYRKDAKLQTNLIDFAAYIAMFPQLIAGPIVRLRSIEDKLHTRTHTLNGFAHGARRFAVGLGKKVLIANNIGAVWDQVSVSDLSQLPVLTAWIGIAAFTLQLYFDFSGYSDMAIGLGKMFGFDFPENFRHPYESRSITEFWRRWHITLGSWFREYVYIPLGGNRKGLKIQLLNIAIVWMLTGLWHGASWNFVLWGLFFAVFLLLEKVLLLKKLEKLPRAVTHLYTIVVVMISWVIFSIEEPGRIASYLKAMFGLGGGLADSQSLYLLTSNLVLFLIAAVGCTHFPAKLGRFLIRDRERGRHARIDESELGVTGGGLILQNLWTLALLVASTGFIIASTYNPFLYFRF